MGWLKQFVSKGEVREVLVFPETLWCCFVYFYFQWHNYSGLILSESVHSWGHLSLFVIIDTRPKTPPFWTRFDRPRKSSGTRFISWRPLNKREPRAEQIQRAGRLARTFSARTKLRWERSLSPLTRPGRHTHGESEPKLTTLHVPG